MSRRRIKKGEELTVDYHFDADADRTPCSCGSKKCRGTINDLPD
jgi:SET domain-containing protein